MWPFARRRDVARVPVGARQPAGAVDEVAVIARDGPPRAHQRDALVLVDSPAQQRERVGIARTLAWLAQDGADDLPAVAKDYIRFIEDEAECPMAIISTGPRREETIIR